MLIIGRGETAADVVFYVSENAKQTSLAVRRGFGFVLSRRFAGQCVDADSSRALYTLTSRRYFGMLTVAKLSQETELRSESAK